MDSKKIFMSYSWKNKDIADIIDLDFQQYGIKLTRDVRDASDYTNLSSFMDRIKEHDYAIFLITDSYLKSRNCMYEATQFMKRQNHIQRTIPIVLESHPNLVGRIYNREKHDFYIEHWNNRFMKLQNKINKARNGRKTLEDGLETIKCVRDNIGRFLSESISNKKLVSFNELKENNYAPIFEYLLSTKLEKPFIDSLIRKGVSSLPNSMKTHKNPYDLVFFDLDGTILQGIDFSWRLVWDYLGYPDDQFRKRGFRMFRKGELSYEEWNHWCVKHYKDKTLRREDFNEITKDLSLPDNFYSSIDSLKNRGIKLGIVSGGISTFLDEMIPKNKNLFDYIFINELTYDSSGILESVKPTKFDFESKLEAVKEVCRVENVPLDRVAFVGEGFNDLVAMQSVGLSIAFTPNDQGIKELSDVLIDKSDLSLILPHILNKN